MTGFAPISFDRQDQYRRLYALAGIRAADYSFTNLWGWAEHYGLEWQFSGSLCWIRQTRQHPCYWAPIGDWNSVDWQKEQLLAPGSVFIRVPDALSEIWMAALPGLAQREETRGHWDYLYKAGELASLSGNRFHKKRNHFNQFLKQYPDHAYHKLTIECVEVVLQMQQEWRQWHECPSESLLAENDAVARVLQDWDRLPGLTGGFITIDGKVAAYTVGEALTGDTLVVHFEKGTTGYRGIYQAINCYFARQEENGFFFVNREQDMDDMGLRQSKTSYNPVDFVKKNTVRFDARA